MTTSTGDTSAVRTGPVISTACIAPFETSADQGLSGVCRALTAGRVWVVRRGDTVWRIGVCTGRDVGDLVVVNRLPDGGRLIFPGDRITVPASAAGRR